MNDNHEAVGRSATASYEEIREARLTAYALGQLDGEEKAAVVAELKASTAARREVAEIQALAEQVREANRSMLVSPSEELRAAVELRLSQPQAPRIISRSDILVGWASPTLRVMRRNWRTWAALAAAVCVLAAAVGLYLGRRDRAVEQVADHLVIEDTPAPQQSTRPVQPQTSEVSKAPEAFGAGSKSAPSEVSKTSEASGAGSENAPVENVTPEAHRIAADSPPKVATSFGGWRPHVVAPAENMASHKQTAVPESPSRLASDAAAPAENTAGRGQDPVLASPSRLASDDAVPAAERSETKQVDSPRSSPPIDKPADPRRAVARTSPRGIRHLPAAKPGFLGPGIRIGPAYMAIKPLEIPVPLPRVKPKQPRDPGPAKFGASVRAPGSGKPASDAKGTGTTRPESVPSKSRPSETHLAMTPGMRFDPGKSSEVSKTGRDSSKPGKKAKMPEALFPEIEVPDVPSPDAAVENEFLPVAKFPYSAFSPDSDPRAYALVDRYLRAGHLPRRDQVEIEGLVNYFGYDDPQPTGDVPFAVRVEAADCPWARDHRLVRIAIVGQDAPATGVGQGRAGQDASPPPIANNVRVQLQFLPAFVASYRLIGYDSPPVAAKKTEGSLAAGWSFPAGQTITALYEVVPASPSKPAVSDARPTKAQRTPARDVIAADASSVTLVVRLRYQRPGAQAYWLLEAPWTDPGQSFDSASRDFRFAAAVAAFGMALRGSQYRGDISLETIERIADSARGEDRQRAEFVDLVRLARELGAGR